MNWTTIIAAAITGIVGLGGIGGSLWLAKKGREAAKADLKVSLDAERERTHDPEKRKAYVEFNRAIESLWIIATSPRTFKTDPRKDLYNDAFTQLWTTYFTISLIASEDLNKVALDITKIMAKYVTHLREGGDPSVEPAGFYEKRLQLINQMRTHLREKELTLSWKELKPDVPK